MAAGRSLALCILEAQQVTALELLRPALACGLRPILATQLWRTALGTDLPPCTVLAVAELFKEDVEVLSGWLRAWAEVPRDVQEDHQLALRVAKALPEALSKCRDATQLLLTGVHHRLAVQSRETRYHGMAVAESLADAWSGEKLRFEDFDRPLGKDVKDVLLVWTFSTRVHRFSSLFHMSFPQGRSRRRGLPAAAALC